MSVVADPIATCLAGDVLVTATGRSLELHRFTATGVQQCEVIEAPVDVGAVQVSSREDLLLVRARDHSTLWQWRRGAGFRQLASRMSARARFSAALVERGTDAYVLVSAYGRLELLENDRQVATVDIGPRPAFDPTHHALVAGDQLAVRGHYADDPYPAYVLVSWQQLLDDPQAMHHALSSSTSIKDQAWHLGVGPAGNDRIVAYRDPQDLELEEDRDPEQPLWGFRGIYFRSVSDGLLGERIPVEASLERARGIVATAELIAIDLSDHILLVESPSGRTAAHRGEAIALDVANARFAVLRNATWQRYELDAGSF